MAIFLMRHAESLANQEEMIVSHPNSGLHRFGLTREGRRQVRKTLTHAPFAEVTKIFSSNFLRAAETAQLIGEHLGMSVSLDSRLGERNFGDFELTPTKNYAQVWEHDSLSPYHTAWSTESVWSVARRMINFFKDLATTETQGDVLVVSHGDPIQILRAIHRDDSPADHRMGSSVEPADYIRLCDQSPAFHDRVVAMMTT